MPSQEDYLDQLLKGIMDEPEDDILKKMVLENATIEDVLSDADEEAASAIFDTLEADTLEADTLETDAMETDAMETDAMEDDAMEEDAIMSEDEIERLLAANNEVEDFGDTSDADTDLMNLLEESSDGELQDIYDMLHKSDNNEAVDEELYALLQGDGEIDEASRLQALLEGAEETAESSDAVLSERQQKAQEKNRRKEEKSAAKRAAKEAKKAEKEAQRAAKKAAKETAKENAESAATSKEAAGADVFAGIDELSTADMLDLQDLLSVGDIQSPSEDAMAQLQQDVQVQSRPVMVDVPEDTVAPVASATDEAMSADMLEIDELLNLAGISGVSEADVADIGTVQDSSADILMLDESEIGDLIPEKKKKSLFARILDLLTETDEDDEEVAKGIEDIPLSDENRNILEEMDKEGKSGKKGKKDKKAKKGKNAPAELDTLDEDGEESAPKGKKGKKPKKAKKEKEQHVKVMPLEDSKSKLSVKSMLSVGAIGASILVLILLLANLGGDFAVKREAKKAYYNEDYETCYQTLYGKELNESEQVMFAKSESILRINLRMREYEMFAEEQSEVEALDVLIETVYDYAELYEYASKWNAGEEVAAVYIRMLGILQDKYHLSESDALEIAAEPNDVEYTKLVTAVAEGKQYSSPKEETVQPENLPDMLPEELKFTENNGGQ